MKLLAIAGVMSAVLVGGQAPQTFAPDAEGFIRNWLVLAPITFEGDSGADELDTPFLRDEALLRPKPGDTARIGYLTRTWQPHETTSFFIDFYEGFGQNGGEYAAAYAVAYVRADREMTVTLAAGSNDQGKLWLNGRQVFAFIQARTLARDADLHQVTLHKGQNVVVFKVVNEVNNWQACLRFLDGQHPVRDIAITLTPE